MKRRYENKRLAPSALVTTLVQEPGLLRLLALQLCQDPASLLAFYHVMRRCPEWRQVTALQTQFDTVWFLAYKATWPGELVHAWELDWMTRRRASWWPEGDSDLLYRMEAIGGTLMATPFGRMTRLAARNGIATNLFARFETPPSAYTLCGAGDGSVLRPSTPASEWPIAALKLRRLVWALLRRVVVVVQEHHQSIGRSTRLQRTHFGHASQLGQVHLMDAKMYWLHSAVFMHLNDALLTLPLTWDRAFLQQHLLPTPHHYEPTMLQPRLAFQQPQWWTDAVGSLYDEIDAQTPADANQTLVEALSNEAEEAAGIVGPQWSWIWDGSAAVRNGFYRRLRDTSEWELARTT